MGQYRSRSRSYSPLPPPLTRRRTRSPPRRKVYDDPRDRHTTSSRPSSYRGGGGGRTSSSRPSNYRGGGGGRSAGPSGLLVRNISLDAKPDDLRIPFERYGPVKDVYLPKNYYTGEPRGFGFVKFQNPEDAVEAKEKMNHQLIGGREIKIVYAEENRKTPVEMRTTSRGDRYGGQRRSSPRSSRRRYSSYSRSPSPVRRDTRERVHHGRDDYFSPARSTSRSPSPRRPILRSPHPRRSVSRSISPHKPITRMDSPGKAISRSPPRRKHISMSPRGPVSRSPSPQKQTARSPSLGRHTARSPSPRRWTARSPSPRRPISRSPVLGKHHAMEERLRSPRQNSLSPSRSRPYSR